MQCRFAFALVAACSIAGPAAAQSSALKVQPVAQGLENPWGVAFLPEGRFLVTERPGRMRVVESDGTLGAPLAGVPEVVAQGQGGLLDVMADSGFARNAQVFFCFSEPGPGGNSTALARARLADDRRSLQDVKVIFSQKPKVRSSAHFGCRIVETPTGTLFMTLGDRFSRKEDAQTLDNHHGKVIHVDKEGRPAPGNPFAGRAGALPEIWSFGHRNGQGATWGPDGKLWMHEHGPQGGDEINVPQAGRNYGWPVITYGENYGGGKIGEGLTAREGLEQPLRHWVPSIAPSGMAFVTSERYPGWKGNLLIGSLKFNQLVRLELQGTAVARETRMDVGERVRDVRQGPDGWLYLLTDSSRGRLLRVQP